MEGEETEEPEEFHQPTAVVINTPSTGHKVIVQLSDDILIETEMPLGEEFQPNLAFVVDQCIRLGDRILLKKADDVMFK